MTAASDSHASVPLAVANAIVAPAAAITKIRRLA